MPLKIFYETSNSFTASHKMYRLCLDNFHKNVVCFSSNVLDSRFSTRTNNRLVLLIFFSHSNEMLPFPFIHIGHGGNKLETNTNKNKHDNTQTTEYRSTYE